VQARLVYQGLQQIAAANVSKNMELRARTTVCATLVHAILLREAALKLLEGRNVTQRTNHALVQVLVKTMALNRVNTVFA